MKFEKYLFLLFLKLLKIGMKNDVSAIKENIWLRSTTLTSFQMVGKCLHWVHSVFAFGKSDVFRIVHFKTANQLDAQFVRFDDMVDDHFRSEAVNEIGRASSRERAEECEAGGS